MTLSSDTPERPPDPSRRDDDEDDEAPETPPTEPSPVPVKDPPAQPGKQGPYVVEGLHPSARFRARTRADVWALRH